MLLQLFLLYIKITNNVLKNLLYIIRYVIKLKMAIYTSPSSPNSYEDYRQRIIEITNNVLKQTYLFTLFCTFFSQFT